MTIRYRCRRNLPALLFQRNLEATSGGLARKRTAAVLCLDKRSGATIFRDFKLDNEIFEYRLETDPMEPLVRLLIPQRTLEMRFTDLPAPPEPPSQYDQGFVVRIGIGGAF